jgi:hypothetical protein
MLSNNINQSENILKGNRIRIVYGHGLAVKSSWSCHVKKKKIRSDEPTRRKTEKIRQASMLKEQITMKGREKI